VPAVNRRSCLASGCGHRYQSTRREADKPRVAVILARTGFAGDTGAIDSSGSAGAVLNNIA